MLPDLSEYNWVIPDFVWELSEQIDLGESCYLLINVLLFLSIIFIIFGVFTGGIDT